MNVIYFMCITGYNSLFFMYKDTTSKKNDFIVQLKMEMNLSLTQPELASFDINYSEHFNILIF
jgi:hypothetical protein